LRDQSDSRLIAPVDNIQLPCGSHTIELINDQEADFRSRSAKVAIRRGKTTKLIVIGNNTRTTIE
jgi:hypothetical protein